MKRALPSKEKETKQTRGIAVLPKGQQDKETRARGAWLAKKRKVQNGPGGRREKKGNVRQLPVQGEKNEMARAAAARRLQENRWETKNRRKEREDATNWGRMNADRTEGSQKPSGRKKFVAPGNSGN